MASPYPLLKQVLSNKQSTSKHLSYCLSTLLVKSLPLAWTKDLCPRAAILTRLYEGVGARDSMAKTKLGATGPHLQLQLKDAYRCVVTVTCVEERCKGMGWAGRVS